MVELTIPICTNARNLYKPQLIVSHVSKLMQIYKHLIHYRQIEAMFPELGRFLLIYRF